VDTNYKPSHCVTVFILLYPRPYFQASCSELCSQTPPN